jgi:cyclopropane fatty-acyl-phospholipid synthase-like methyltransferase
MSEETELPTRARFEDAYAAGRPPWDIDGPQPVFVEAAHRIAGSVLDAGCGTGENALFFAGRGHAVLGIDFLDRPIRAAKRKAELRGLAARFLVHDALRLDEFGERFDSVVDSGLFHVFSDGDRARYVRSLRAAVNPGGRVFLACFSDQEPGDQGPRRVTRTEIRATFEPPWDVESIEEARFQTRSDHSHLAFSPGGPFAWFCVIRRMDGS